MVNRLGDSLSPYLRQHADNPVDWWEWCPEAFAEARERDVPVLLSVGYAACHWCHVMAHESFEDEAVAAYLNEHFVSIKVDREERPDVDSVYMAAVVATTRHAGWPMTVFLTPDGEPFHAGTYYPPVPVQGMPSFVQVLAAASQAWREQRTELTAHAGAVLEHLRASARGAGAAGTGPDVPEDAGTPLSQPELADAVRLLAEGFDPVHGGFGGAPKFPPSMTLEHLLRHHARTGDPTALAMARDTCRAMARGGIHDHLDGGFARYSVDAAWVVPHFEKMLYDNAQLLGVYARLWRATGEAWAREVAESTAGFLLTALRTEEGAFASSLDADSDGREGAFAVWTPGELTDALGPDDGRWAAELLGVTPEGTFEHGTSVLRLTRDPDSLTEDERRRWSHVRERLRAVRARRTAPARDDKVVTAWNGLAVSALTEAGMILDRPDWVRAAEEAAGFLVDAHLREDGRLRRVSRGGRPGEAEGVLEDYGLLADALLTLTSATGDPRWHHVASRLLEVVLTEFVDADGVHDTPATGGAAGLVLRPADPADNASPSGRSAAAGALLRHAALTGSQRHRLAAHRALALSRDLMVAAPRFAGHALAVAEAIADGPREVAIVGPSAEELIATAWSSGAPGLAIAVPPPDRQGDQALGPAGADTEPAAAPDLAPGRTVEPEPEAVPDADAPPEQDVVPLLRDRPARDGRATAYVCRGFQCELPVGTPEELRALLGRGR